MLHIRDGWVYLVQVLGLWGREVNDSVGTHFGSTCWEVDVGFEE